MVCEGWEGNTVDGKFPLLEWLGGWADRCVFLTVRQGIQRANIKMLLATGSEADAKLANWQAAAVLPHPSLLQLMETGRFNIRETDGVYVVTEKADTFLSQIIPRKALDPSQVKAILEPIVDALGFLHGKGLTHGNLKPANIVGVGDQWKLASDEIVEPGEFARADRKPDAYDAPEILDGKLTPAVDMWSLGIIAVEAFSQRTPVWDRDARADLGVPVWVMPEPFREMARGCLRWEPTQRISIDEAKALLGRYTPSGDAREVEAEKPETAPVWNSTPPVAAHEPSVEATTVAEPAAVEPVDSFRDLEAAEFAPRSRLFSNLGEEEEHTGRKGSIGAVILVLLVVAVVVAVRFRGRIFSPGETRNAPAESQSAPPQTTHKEAGPSQAAPATPNPPGTSQPQTGSVESQSAHPASQPPPTPAPAATKPKEPAPSAETESQPTPKPETSAPPAPEEETPPARAANSKGEVVKRVLPDVEPGATRSMRRPMEVELRVSVDEDGRVSNVEYVTRGPGNYFARKARQAAQAWKFKAPESNGQAVASQWVLLFRFERRRTDVTATEVH